MKRILVPTDFSPESEYALKIGAYLAKKNKAELYLLHLLELPMHLASAPVGELPEAFFFTKLAQQKIEELKEKPFLKDIKVHEIMEAGSIHSGVSNAIKDKAIDFVVMGSSGAAGLEEIFIGSNTEKVVRTATVPVLIIKNDINELKIDNFVYACDFSTDTFEAYKKAITFGEKFNSKIHLLFVNTPNNFNTSRAITDKIASFTKKLTPKNYTVNIYNELTIEDGILNFAKETNADLIGMSTHGRRGITHFFNGSITEELSNHALRPVITFRI
ncbi:Nucleotide-binding universal stress protein, UspA family [Zhouia amylolytica]|uniref:Nucleotide-binding universal stress protein, UspA family n=1 Tax=Zhouia amylolytica TaxID=376730 RepID=A0A1I6VDT7_9FLAO|nr:universal stress protein [Zhouia amylolytica]SFT11811.1 Nucleotide-binding universal stress protein, UspA family [Zhouia amylolytica]